MKANVTLRDIADHLGVAQSTVSRVLNGTGRVGAETRARILEYAESVNYTPNRLGLNLKLQKSGTVGILLPDINNDFYSVLFKVLDRHLRAASFQPILFDTNENKEREREYVSYLQSSVVDGMIVATSGSSVYSELPDSLLERIVFIDNKPSLEKDICFVGSDNYASSRQLTAHLIEQGHRNIATLVGMEDASSAEERLAAFRDELREQSIDLPEKWVVRTNFLYDDGYQQAKKLLEQKDRPTAIIAQNNVLAYAAIRVAQEMDLQVPGDIDVACFDHIDVYGFMRPVITTAVQSLDLLGKKAADRLIVRLSGRKVEPGEEIIPAEFRAGETTAARE